jgi:hypothetical protein
MNCINKYVINPKSGRCVKKSGKIGSKLESPAVCRKLIENTRTGRCVKKGGKTAESLKTPVKYPKGIKNANYDINDLRYRSSAESIFTMLLYFSYKYPNDCIIIPNSDKKKKKWQDISLFYDYETGFIIPKNYFEQFSKCENKRFIVMPFIMSCSRNSVHVNLLIYDSKNKSMERFEPNGSMSNPCYNVGIDMNIQKIFSRKFGKNFIHQYYKPLDFCPEINFQKIAYSEDEGGKFCGVWASWYADLRLLNPDINRKELVERSIKGLKSNKRKANESLTSFIKNYANMSAILREMIETSKNPNDVFKQIIDMTK